MRLKAIFAAGLLNVIVLHIANAQSPVTEPVNNPIKTAPCQICCITALQLLGFADNESAKKGCVDFGCTWDASSDFGSLNPRECTDIAGTADIDFLVGCNAGRDLKLMGLTPVSDDSLVSLQCNDDGDAQRVSTPFVVDSRVIGVDDCVRCCKAIEIQFDEVSSFADNLFDRFEPEACIGSCQNFAGCYDKFSSYLRYGCAIGLDLLAFGKVEFDVPDNFLICENGEIISDPVSPSPTSSPTAKGEGKGNSLFDRLLRDNLIFVGLGAGGLCFLCLIFGIFRSRRKHEKRNKNQNHNQLQGVIIAPDGGFTKFGEHEIQVNREPSMKPPTLADTKPKYFSTWMARPIQLPIPKQFLKSTVMLPKVHVPVAETVHEHEGLVGVPSMAPPPKTPKVQKSPVPESPKAKLVGTPSMAPPPKKAIETLPEPMHRNLVGVPSMAPPPKKAVQAEPVNRNLVGMPSMAPPPKKVAQPGPSTAERNLVGMPSMAPPPKKVAQPGPSTAERNLVGMPSMAPPPKNNNPQVAQPGPSTVPRKLAGTPSMAPPPKKVDVAVPTIEQRQLVGMPSMAPPPPKKVATPVVPKPSMGPPEPKRVVQPVAALYDESGNVSMEGDDESVADQEYMPEQYDSVAEIPRFGKGKKKYAQQSSEATIPPDVPPKISVAIEEQERLIALHQAGLVEHMEGYEATPELDALENDEEMENDPDAEDAPEPPPRG